MSKTTVCTLVIGMGRLFTSSPQKPNPVTLPTSNVTEKTEAATPHSPDSLPNASDNTDYDCSDFSGHEEAQQYFESQGGSPSNNVDRLDRDRDGIACEQSE